MNHPVNIRGILHSVRLDRLVLHNRTYCHIMFYPNITPDEVERWHERVGTSVSIWAVQGKDGLVLKKADKATGMTPP